MNFPGLQSHSPLALALSLAAMLVSPPAVADGPYYYVVNPGTQMAAEVFAHHTEDGSAVVLWSVYGGTSQQFTVQRLEGNGPYQPEEERWFLLRVRHADKCLKTDGFQSGAPVVLAPCGGDASQMWRERMVSMTAAGCGSPGGCFAGFRRVIENYYDRGRRCLDAANAAFPNPPPEGAGLQAFDCIDRYSAPNAINQEWELVRIEDWGAPGPVVR